MDDQTRNSRRFLVACPLLLLSVFALPLLLRPYTWAKVFGWRQDEPETDVGLYFGRCLGALATAICIQMLVAARDPAANRRMFRLAELTSWLLVAVHARGALERRQPPIEHAEIGGYAAVALLARRFAPPAS